MKLTIRATIISVVLLGGAIGPGVVHSGNLLKANGVSTAQDANDYYATIDPDNDRLTQAAWRTVNGFDPSSGNEVVVVQGHRNTSDLGLWRRLEMVIDKRPGKVGNVAMTTYNFELGPNDANPGGLTKCCNPDNAASIVNMEYSPGPNGDRITKFYIYDAAGNRKLSTFFDRIDREELYLPNGCASCHGGGENFRDSGGDVGGGFLAFDFNVFDYTGSNTTRDANEANVKKLNQGVLKTNPPNAVKRLVRGLYGGNRLPLAKQLSSYRPSSWDTEPALWNVVVTDCQGCHTLSEQEVLDLNYWKSTVRDFREEVLQKKLMPNSPTANRRFFDETSHHQIVKEALERFGP